MRNRCLILALWAAFLIGLCLPMGYGYTGHASSFYGQNNPFNLYYGVSKNYSLTISSFPSYSYITLINISITDNLLENTMDYTGNWDGTQNKSVDGNWSTVADGCSWQSGYPGTALYFNYTNLTGRDATSVWRLKWGDGYEIYDVNFTIPLTCRDNESILKFRVIFSNDQGQHAECYNSSWVRIFKNDTGTVCNANAGVFEQELISNATYEKGAYVYFGGQQTNFNSSTQILLNTTIANNLLANNIPLNITFHSNNPGTITVNLTNATYSYGLSNCTNIYGIPYNATGLNFTAYHEDNGSRVDITTEGVFDYPNENYTFTVTNQNNFSICVYPSWFNVSVNATLQYAPTNGITERYYLVETRISNVTQLVNLYAFSYTSGISTLTGIVKTNVFKAKPNVLVKMQRYYPGEALWKTIQVDLSDEFGKVIFYVIQKEVEYKFIFEENGAEIYRTVRVKFSCETATSCEQTFIMYDTLADDEFTDMGGEITFNNATKIYTFTWSDPGTTASTVRFLVEKQASDKVMQVCNNISTDSSGTINCNVSAYSGTITARAFRSASPDHAWLVHTVTIGATRLADLIGNAEGMALSSILLIGLIGFGAATGSAVGVVIIGILGLIMVFLAELTTIVTLTMVVSGVALGAIIAFMVKR